MAGPAVLSVYQDGMTLVAGDGTRTRMGTLTSPIDGEVYQTTAGLVFDDATNIIELLRSNGTLTALSSKGAAATGVVVGPGHDTAAWGESGSDADPSSVLKLYDSTTGRVVHQVHLAFQGLPVGILADGRVAVADQLSSHVGVLWQPATGQLTALPKGTFLGGASGHTLVVTVGNDGCAVALRDSDSGASVGMDGSTACTLPTEVSPDGKRWLALMPGATQGGNLETIVDAATGAWSKSLAMLLVNRNMSVTDASWLDEDHVLFIAFTTTAGRSDAFELSCTVPTGADPTCATVADFGVFDDTGVSASSGPTPVASLPATGPQTLPPVQFVH